MLTGGAALRHYANQPTHLAAQLSIPSPESTQSMSTRPGSRLVSSARRRPGQPSTSARPTRSLMTITVALNRRGYAAHERHFVCKIIYNFFSQRTGGKKRIHRGDTHPAPHTDTHLNNSNKVSTFLNPGYGY